MRARLLSTLAVLGVLAPATAARVPGGGVVRAVRRRAVAEVHVYTFVGTSAIGRLQGLSTPRRGERYTIVDAGGAIAEVIVGAVERIDTDGCPGEFYVQAHVTETARLNPPGGGDVWAIGPTRERLDRARIVDPSTVATPPQPASFDRRLQLVFDRDGDRVPDVFLYHAYCDGPRLTAWGVGPELCVEVWASEGRTTELTARARTRVCGATP